MGNITYPDIIPLKTNGGEQKPKKKKKHGKYEEVHREIRKLCKETKAALPNENCSEIEG